MTFNVGGLTNEYDGSAYFLKDGEITEVPCFQGYEILDFPDSLDKLEAFVTSGGLSTAPWTFRGSLQRLENKTLRYPGHRDQFLAFSQLGLLGLEEMEINGEKVVPRYVFHALLENCISAPFIRDVAVMRVKGMGCKDGKPAEAVVEVVDRYDEGTGFTAMQRLTGWHASAMLILATRGELDRGAVSVERAVSGRRMVGELEKRGIVFKLTEQYL